MSGEAPSLGRAAGSAEQPRLRWLKEFWGSTLGKKIIVAATGAILMLYVILHAAGNLKALQGAGSGSVSAIDEYAEFLRDAGTPVLPDSMLLWAIRVLLITAFVVHIIGVTQLIQRNRAARPGKPPVIQRSLSSRTMAVTGSLLLAFIVFHVLQFTTLTVEPTPLEAGEVYANVYNAFQETWLVVLYVAMMAVLYLHLRHALWSVVQTGGWDKPNRNPTFRRGATATAVAVSVAFALVPIMFFVGAMPEPLETSSEASANLEVTGD